MLLTFNGNNNRADQWGYDAAGDVTYDTANMYEYDAEGRQTGVLDPTTGVLTGYIYDAEGQRVEKVLVNGWNTPTPTTTVENEYLLGPNGEQVTVLGVNAAWQWTNVYAGARQLATYDSAGTHFTVTDWLGTKRMQLGVTAASTVTVGEQCTSLPYGDGLNCSGSDVNHLYFTGKERDTESGNDYFLARYYSSNMGGRFLTPDWSKNPQSVPYANYTNPQTLNLYAYVGDNPLSLADADGHCTDTTNGPCKLAQAAKKNSDAEQSKSQQQGNCNAVSHPCTTITVHGSPDNTTPDLLTAGITNIIRRVPYPQPSGPFPFVANSVVVQTPKPPVKKPSYSAFLGCYYNSVIQTITSEEDGRGQTAYGFMNAGAAWAIKREAYNPIGLTFVASAALMDTGAMVKANVDCTKQAGY